MARNGKKRYPCRACGRNSRSTPGQSAYSEAHKIEILRHYQDRTSIFGVLRQTVMAWLKKLAAYRR